MAIHLPMYSRSPKNPTLQLLQKSSKSASTTPQRPIWNTFGTVAVRDFFGRTAVWCRVVQVHLKRLLGRTRTSILAHACRRLLGFSIPVSTFRRRLRFLHPTPALGGYTSSRSAAASPALALRALRRRPRSAAAPALCGGARALRRRPRSAAAPALCGGARALRRCSCSAAVLVLCSGARALRRRPRSAAAPALCGGARALRRCSCSAAVLVLCGGARALRRCSCSAAVLVLCSGPRALRRRPRSAAAPAPCGCASVDNHSNLYVVMSATPPSSGQVCL